MALDRIRKALRYSAPIAPSYEIKITDKILVYRKRIKRWEGLFVVTNVQGKVIFTDQADKSKQYSIDKVRPISRNKDDDKTTRANQNFDPSKIVSRDRSENYHVNRPNGQGKNNTARPRHHTSNPQPCQNPQNYTDSTQSDIERSHETVQPSISEYMAMDIRIPEEYKSIHTNAVSSDSLWDIDMIGDILADALSYDSSIADILLVKTIDINAVNDGKSDFLEAKEKEISDLKKRKIWRLVNSKQFLRDAKIIRSHFVLTIKNYQTPNKIVKASYIAQGSKD